MPNEKKTDLFIAKLLDAAKIKYTPNGSSIADIADALKTASKKKTQKVGFPEFVGQSKDFVLVIEDKAELDKQALYSDDSQTELAEDGKALTDYAENGALHYARAILANTSWKKIFAFGCSGDEVHHKIRPLYVDPSGYRLLHEVENFENFSEENIEKYYREQVKGETAAETLELESILRKAAELHEHLRNYGQLGDSEKPLVVSALLLALSEKDFNIDNLTGDDLNTDGQKIFTALSAHMSRVKVQPETKKSMILNQFTMIKDRKKLNEIEPRLAKTPLRYFAEFIKKDILASVVSNSPDDVLGRFYGEFIRYSGGDGQSLGVVLTPKHITELFCKLARINAEDIVFDPCCGTGGFLIAAMHTMLEDAAANTADRKEREKKIAKIKREQIYGVEFREDMFSIATTNMILRGDGKSNLICDDFLTTSSKRWRKKKISVGFINPPYSQAKGKDTAHLSEICFVKHLLDSLADGARCIAIVPQSVMIGKTKEDKTIKEEILKKHTLEGVITLSKETFYRIGVNPCIVVFTAHRKHPKGKFCKFINFEDDGFVTKKHVGFVETERAKERFAHLLSCWNDGAKAESRFVVESTVDPNDEWLHSFYYFNDEVPTDADFEKIMADYLTFEFNMIAHGKGYLFGMEEGK